MSSKRNRRCTTSKTRTGAQGGQGEVTFDFNTKTLHVIASFEAERVLDLMIGEEQRNALMSVLLERAICLPGFIDGVGVRWTDLQDPQDPKKTLFSRLYGHSPGLAPGCVFFDVVDRDRVDQIEKRVVDGD